MSSPDPVRVADEVKTGVLVAVRASRDIRFARDAALRRAEGARRRAACPRRNKHMDTVTLGCMLCSGCGVAAVQIPNEKLRTAIVNARRVRIARAAARIAPMHTRLSRTPDSGA